MRRNRAGFALVITILICCITAHFLSTVYAQYREKISPTLEKAIGLYKHENFDEALILLKQARDEEPASTLAAYYMGLTYKQMQDYRSAIPALRDAVTYSPKIKGALIELIDCLYQTGDLEQAGQWIAEAEREDVRPAQTAFLKGLVLMKLEKPSDAIEAFEKAKRLDPSMEQACAYQIGVAHLKNREYAQANDVFRQVIITNPNSTMANYANEYVNAIGKAPEMQKPWRIEAGIAWEYDSNVVLLPDTDSAAVGISDKGDSREVTTALAEYNYRPNDKFGIRGQYSFYWAKQNNLGFYDTVSQSFILQPTAYTPDSMLSIPVGFNLVNVNDKAYLATPSCAVSYNTMFRPWIMGQALALYRYKNYFWAPWIPDENRNSNELAGSYGWYLFFDKNRGFFNVRYTLNNEWTAGQDWAYVGNRATAALLIPSTAILPKFDRMNLTVSADAFFQNFHHTNVVYDIQRRDQVYTLSALASYKIYKDSEIVLQYTCVKDNSNISVYEYTRNIYHAGVNIKF